MKFKIRACHRTFVSVHHHHKRNPPPQPQTVITVPKTQVQKSTNDIGQQQLVNAIQQAETRLAEIGCGIENFQNALASTKARVIELRTSSENQSNSQGQALDAISARVAELEQIIAQQAGEEERLRQAERDRQAAESELAELRRQLQGRIS